MSKQEARATPIATGNINLVFVLPALVLFGTFVLLPLALAVVYAFTSWNGFSQPEWVGLANFGGPFWTPRIYFLTCMLSSTF